ncbi:hypothetical protein GCM10015536_70030 [Streptomyces griseomycini]|nr:hypothetical protein GCM10015536_70030 [Streptomyces griseomycini]
MAAPARKVVPGDLDGVGAYRLHLVAAVTPPIPLVAGDDQATARVVELFCPSNEGVGGVFGKKREVASIR